MPFALERQNVVLVNFNARSEMHGEERAPAADLKLSMDAPNDVLAEFDPALKSSLYRRPDGNDSQAELLDVPGYLPKLRFPKMGGFGWDEKIVGATLTIHWGANDRSQILLTDCIVDRFAFEPADGGTVQLSFRVACHPDEKQAGKLYTLTQSSVEISLAPPNADGAG